jgi:hypothetical protein
MKLQEFGCNVILNDRVTNPHNQMIGEITVLELQSGKILEYDACIPAYNRGPNTQWLTEVRLLDLSLPLSGVLNDKKQVIVDEYLTPKEYPKLFAIGATNDRGEAIIGMNVHYQAQTITANILSPQSKKTQGMSCPVSTVSNHWSQDVCLCGSRGNWRYHWNDCLQVVWFFMQPIVSMFSLWYHLWANDSNVLWILLWRARRHRLY